MEFSLQARRLLENGQHTAASGASATEPPVDRLMGFSLQVRGLPETTKSYASKRKTCFTRVTPKPSRSLAKKNTNTDEQPTYLPTYLPYMLRLAVFSCRECLNSWREEDVTVKSAGATEPPADTLMEFSPQARRLLKTVNTAVPGASATESWAD